MKPQTWFNGLAIFLSLALTVLSGILVYRGGGTGVRVVVRGAEGQWIYPQGSVETITVPGPLGDTVVELRNGEARILSSPCTNQTCVSAGKIHAPRQWLACLPNRILVSVESGSGQDGGLDALVW